MYVTGDGANGGLSDLLGGGATSTYSSTATVSNSGTNAYASGVQTVEATATGAETGLLGRQAATTALVASNVAADGVQVSEWWSVEGRAQGTCSSDLSCRPAFIESCRPVRGRLEV
jgi:hypothetical protein